MNDHTPANYHVLLIGVDGYRRAPLGGCVNDIDAVHRVLTGSGMAAVRDRLRIRRLASPAPGARDAAAAQPATLDNLRAALTALGSSEVAAGDRVFIYYAGHGARALVTAADGRRFHREALVPVDYDADPRRPQLLYDYELNTLLRKIVTRTRSVTLVLDCCHSAGATREGAASRDRQPRYIDLSNLPALPDPAPASRGSAEVDAAAFGAVEDCHVVAACLAHELAQEERGTDLARRGLLTGAFIAALESAPAGDLTAMTWARIWQAMCAHVQERNPWQHPTMIGHPARAVFGGPPVTGDAGFMVSQTGTAYRIAAGTLAGVTQGTELAIYGERPPFFPPLGSAPDDEVRIGLLRVARADRAMATAEAIGSPFELPPAARGRLVKAGSAARLTCTLVPDSGTDASVIRMLEAQIARSPLIELVKPPSKPDVRLEQRGGRWMIIDKVHGGGNDGPVLFALQPAELDCARAVLEHYHAYARPLRMAERASDLPGGLRLELLAVDRQLSPSEAQAASLPGTASSLSEAPTRGAGTYTLQSGARVCFRVRNESIHRLRVTLLNSAGSGKVQLLGDEVIEGGGFHVFWARGSLGSPFQMSPPPNCTQCIDRMVAIGRTAMDNDLGYLRVDKSFAQVIQPTRDAGYDRDIGGADEPIEHWTAAQAIIETRDPRRP